MAEDSGIKVDELRVDGGPTKNGYLMQFQSDILDIPVQVPEQRNYLLWARHMPLESLWEFTNRLHYLKVLTAPDLPLRWMRRQDAQNIQAGKRVLDSY